MTNEFEKAFEEIIASQKMTFIASDKSLQDWRFKQDQQNAAITKSYAILAYKAGMDRAKELAETEYKASMTIKDREAARGAHYVKQHIESEMERLFP